MKLRLAGPRSPVAETISRSLIPKDSPLGESILVVKLLRNGSGIHSAHPLENARNYEQARELYRQGPTKGPAVVRLLREHITAYPKDIDAVSLLGITLFGIEKPEEALPVIDRAIELASEKKEIRPKMVILKARTLHHLRRPWECKRLLETYSP